MRLLFLSRTHKQKQNPCFTSSLGSSLPLRAGRSSVRAALSHIFCSVLLYFFFFWFFSAAPPPLLPCQRRPLFPFRAVTLLCNQLLQYGLELPKQIGRPTKRRTTVVAPLWVFSAGALYQVLNAEAAMNEIMGRGAPSSGGGGVGGGGGHSLKPHKNSRTIRVQARALLFPPPRVSGFLCADRQAGGIRQGRPPFFSRPLSKPPFH